VLAFLTSGVGAGGPGGGPLDMSAMAAEYEGVSGGTSNGSGGVDINDALWWEAAVEQLSGFEDLDLLHDEGEGDGESGAAAVAREGQSTALHDALSGSDEMGDSPSHQLVGEAEDGAAVRQPLPAQLRARGVRRCGAGGSSGNEEPASPRVVTRKRDGERMVVVSATVADILRRPRPMDVDELSWALDESDSAQEGEVKESPPVAVVEDAADEEDALLQGGAGASRHRAVRPRRARRGLLGSRALAARRTAGPTSDAEDEGDGSS
jgi:hypothetical protein